MEVLEEHRHVSGVLHRVTNYGVGVLEYEYEHTVLRSLFQDTVDDDLVLVVQTLKVVDDHDLLVLRVEQVVPRVAEVVKIVVDDVLVVRGHERHELEVDVVVSQVVVHPHTVVGDVNIFFFGSLFSERREFPDCYSCAQKETCPDS